MHLSGAQSSTTRNPLMMRVKHTVQRYMSQHSVYLWSSEGRWWWEGVGEEEDGGDDSGGIATGTQKRGSKQGEALTSACFTFERDRGQKRRRRREQEDRLQIGKQDKRKKRDKEQGWEWGGGERRAQGKAMWPRDIRQVQFNSIAARRQQNTGGHTHKAAGCSQAAAARGHYRAAQAASDSPQAFPIVRLHPKTPIPQHHWLQREKMSVRRWRMDPTDDPMNLLKKELCTLLR